MSARPCLLVFLRSWHAAVTGDTHPAWPGVTRSGAASSRITIPDYAPGIVGHLENPAAHGKQITFAC